MLQVLALGWVLMVRRPEFEWMGCMRFRYQPLGQCRGSDPAWPIDTRSHSCNSPVQLEPSRATESASSELSIANNEVTKYKFYAFAEAIHEGQ